MYSVYGEQKNASEAAIRMSSREIGTSKEAKQVYVLRFTWRYDIRKYEKYVSNMSGEETNKGKDDRLERGRKQSRIISDSGSTGLPTITIIN